MISFLNWLKHGFVGSPELREHGQAVIQFHKGRVGFYAIRRVYKKDQGWFRRSYMKLGLPTVIVAFNICEWDEDDFMIRCLHPDSPDFVAAEHGEEAFRWKYVTPLRNQEDAKGVHAYLMELENKLVSTPQCLELQDGELRLMRKIWELLKDLPCQSTAVT